MMQGRQIVVTRLQNIGDMIVFLPALRRLKENMPDAKVTLLCKHPGGIEIASQCPWVDDMIVIRNRSLREKLRIIMQLRRMHVDMFIVSPQDQGKVPWGVMGGAKKIAAFPEIWYKGVVKREKWRWAISIRPEFKRDKTETENSITLIDAALDACGIRPSATPDCQPVYSRFKPETEPKIERILSGFRKTHDTPLIVSSIISKGASKNWPAENYVSLFRRLIDAKKAQVILIGAASDKDKYAEVTARFSNDEMRSFAGEFSIDESACMIKKANLYIGTDSGPAHIANAVGTPSVVFFKRENAARWLMPYDHAKKEVIIAEDNDIKSIPEETVFSACMKFL